MKKQLYGIILGLLLTTGIYGQSYWQETIDTVSASGYYNIEPSQEIAGLGLPTWRIYDANNKEVPYLVRSSVPVKEMKQMEMYDLVSHTKKDSINTIIVHYTGGEVSRFYLLMKAADVVKYITIRGSYDRREWFSVKQHSLLKSENNPNLGAIAIVDFPKGDYTYYELVISNNSRSPLNITGVGKIEKSSIYGQFVELNPGQFKVEEEDHNTVITFPAMPYPYYLSKLDLKVTGKGHYNRDVHIRKQGYSMDMFKLSSRDEPVFYFNELLIDKDIRIVIENQNNPPLVIDGIQLSGLSRYMCAYLEKGMAYRIETSTERHRRYDIEDFASDIPFHLPVIKTTGLKEKMKEVPPEREPGFFETPAFLWSVILLTGIGLVFICLRMLKEMKKNSKGN